MKPSGSKISFAALSALFNHLLEEMGLDPVELFERRVVHIPLTSNHMLDRIAPRFVRDISLRETPEHAMRIAEYIWNYVGVLSAPVPMNDRYEIPLHNEGLQRFRLYEIVEEFFAQDPEARKMFQDGAARENIVNFFMKALKENNWRLFDQRMNGATVKVTAKSADYGDIGPFNPLGALN